MQVSSWKSASSNGSDLEMFKRDLGQVFYCTSTLSTELGHGASTLGTGWSGMMGTCHQETLQVLLVSGPDHQQTHYPTHILCHKQESSHTTLSYLFPRDRSAPGGWRHQYSYHGESLSPHMGTLPAILASALPSPGTARADTLSSSVQFSKEKYILDSSPEKLHKELEEELKLSSTDLRSHAWYHGRIPREVRRGRWVAPGTLCCLGRAP